jgi:hypothetical protein
MTQSRLDRAVVGGYFVFLVLSQLVVFTVFSSLLLSYARFDPLFIICCPVSSLSLSSSGSAPFSSRALFSHLSIYQFALLLLFIFVVDHTNTHNGCSSQVHRAILPQYFTCTLYLNSAQNPHTTNELGRVQSKGHAPAISMNKCGCAFALSINRSATAVNAHIAQSVGCYSKRTARQWTLLILIPQSPNPWSAVYAQGGVVVLGKVNLSAYVLDRDMHSTSPRSYQPHLWPFGCSLRMHLQLLG